MRLTMLLAALMVAAHVQAAPTTTWANALVLTQAPAPADDEDEDEDESTPAPTPPGGAPAATPAPATAAAPAPAAEPAPAAPAEEMKLVSGAPLYNPNVAVHIVEQKQFSDSGKREITLYPAAVQVNGKFTQHFGTMGSFVWHLQENFGLQLSGGYNWYNTESAFNGELVDKVRAEAQAATSLLWVWGVLGGVEVTPLYGKFAFFEGTLAHFSLVLSGGAGVGGTRHQLKPQNTQLDGSVTPATFGETGLRFMGSLGAGFRLQLGSRFAFRVEVRDVVYTARVERVNGCNAIDLKAMDDALRGGREPTSVANLSNACRVEEFSGTDPATNQRRSINVTLAHNLVKVPSSDVLNNVGLYVGASLLF